MKKILLVLLLLIIVAVAGGAYFVVKNLDSFIAQTIEKEGTAALGSKVSVSQVTTKLKEGQASISGITIANPAGYQNAHALSLNQISAEVDYADQVIKQVTINQPIINAELKGSTSNFQDLLDNKPEDEDEEGADDEQSSDQVITIKKISLLKATVNLLATDYAPGASYGLSNTLDLDTSFIMDDFILTNISGTSDEITEEVSEKLIQHIKSQVTAYAVKEVKAQATAELKEKATEKINEVIGDKLGDKLKGLF